MSRAINWSAGPHSISLTIRPEGSYLSFPNHEPGNFNLIFLTCYIHISHRSYARCYTIRPPAENTCQFVFMVNTPSTVVLDSFPIQIYGSLTEWLNHQASCQGCTPSGGWLNLLSPHPFSLPRSLNLQAAFNEMSSLWHGPRPRSWTCCQETSSTKRSLRFTVPVSWPGLKVV